jgi:hypothetical protein
LGRPAVATHGVVYIGRDDELVDALARVAEKAGVNFLSTEV